MCNAWNHPPGCLCGWGGEGHAGRNEGGFSPFLPSYFRDPFIINKESFDSYVNPNAKCPVCGAKVFFYKSPDGGKVFFDDLGPPWPKHPCTDNKLINENAVEVYDNQQTTVKQPQWVHDGWYPVTVASVGSAKSQYYVVLLISDKHMTKYIRTCIFGGFIDKLKKPDILTFIKNLTETEFELIVYNILTGDSDSVLAEVRE